MKYSVKSGRIVAHKNPQVFCHDNLKTNFSRRVFYVWRTADWFAGTWRLLEMTAPLNSAAVTDVAIHSMHRKGYQSKLLVVHSKRGWCNFWGLLYCDDRRSPWWASCDGPQHDRNRSETVMICMNCNSYADLVNFSWHGMACLQTFAWLFCYYLPACLFRNFTLITEKKQEKSTGNGGT